MDVESTFHVPCSRLAYGAFDPVLTLPKFLPQHCFPHSSGMVYANMPKSGNIRQPTLPVFPSLPWPGNRNVVTNECGDSIIVV